MLKEPVAHQITRGTLEAVASVHPKWQSPEAVWNAFRAWSSGRGKELALSYEEKPPYFHELLELYDFGIEACPKLGRDGFLKLSGRCFAGIIFRERLHDLVAMCLTPEADVPAAIEGIIVRFLEQYSGTLYRIRTRHTSDEVSFTLSYSEPEGIDRHLRAFDRDPKKSFDSSFRVIVATAELGMETLLDPWKSEWLEFDSAKGTARIRIPKGTKFNYKRQVETLTRFAHQLEKRHAEHLFTRDLEHDMILQSPFMREKWERIMRASATDELILLRGEPGTGKTYLAERIHQMSARKGRPFVEVGLTADVGVDNLVQSHLFGHVKGAFTSAHEDKPGLFSLSNSGTIFLDEIGDASPDLQAKLLRVIEKKTFKPLGSTRDVVVDVRIIAATNKDLERMARDGRFREDLYHRLNVIQIEMPSLRERRSEIPLLAAHFLRRISAEVGKPSKPLARETTEFLASYPWPGNIRELIHVLKYALLFSLQSDILLKDLPEYVFRNVPSPTSRFPSAAAAATDEVINFERLCALLAQNDAIPVGRKKTADCPWHVDFARKTYLRALIRHCKGNLRKIASYWDRESEKTVRAVIKEFGLWDELERSRGEK